jgi:hypothetical protein
MACLLLLLPALSGCGGSSGETASDPRLQLTTPPAVLGALPVEVPPPPAERALREADLPKLRSVVTKWADALSRNDTVAATRFFRLPAIVSLPSTGTVEVRDPIVMSTFNSRLPCGAKVGAVRKQGRYLVSTFVLTDRPGHVCTSPGELVKVGFVFSGRRFSEFWQEADAKRGSMPGPKRRPKVPPADVATFGG